MFVVAVDSFEDSTIVRIFTTIGDWHFSKGYPEKVALLSRVCIFVNFNSQNNKSSLREKGRSIYKFNFKSS